MKTRLNRVLIHVKIIVLLLSISDTSLAQFDSTIWSNYYSNHSVSSRDNVFSVNLNDKDELLITGRVENDFSNFDISNILLNNNLDLVWKNNYSTDEADISDDHPSDVVYDSAGNIYVAGFRNHYWTSAVCYPYPVFYKLDSKGKHLWSYLFEDFAGNDHPFEAYFLDIECDKSGNCYLLAEGWQPGLTPNARTFIMKFDQEGRRIWCKKTLLYDVKKLLVDNNQDIFIINNDDEDQNRETIIQKYSESGELISEHRYSNYNFDHFDAKIDKNNSLWIFSDINTQGHVDKYASDILISHYDTGGSLLDQKIYKSQFQDYVSLKQVSFYNDSTFLIGIDSNSPENGLDNLLILVNDNLQVVDSFRYDSEWNDNDYLISFDVADDSSVIVTGISFIDYNYSFPYVSKIDHFKHIDWINIPSIADSIETFPKKVFSGSDGTIFLVGDVSMTINPECGYYTHSNYFVTKFDDAGNEILTREFGESGKSFIVGKKARLDKHNNIYISGYDQYGPDYIYPISYYREGIILQKYSGDGILKWNTKIPMPKTKIDYINHFITSDSLITVIGGYSGVPYGFSLLYNIDSNGLVLDSAKYDWKVLSAVRDKDGNFYLFFLVDQNIQIIKCDTKLEILKSASVPGNDCFDFITSCENGLIYLLCRDSRYLYKLDSELNLKGQIILSSYFSYVDSFLVDELDNIYLAGRKDSGILIKLNQAGERLWNCKVEKLYSADRGMDRLSTGDLVLFGSENPVVGSNPSGIALISQDGALKKYITIDCLYLTTWSVIMIAFTFSVTGICLEANLCIRNTLQTWICF